MLVRDRPPAHSGGAYGNISNDHKPHGRSDAQAQQSSVRYTTISASMQLSSMQSALLRLRLAHSLAAGWLAGPAAPVACQGIGASAWNLSSDPGSSAHASSSLSRGTSSSTSSSSSSPHRSRTCSSWIISRPAATGPHSTASSCYSTSASHHSTMAPELLSQLQQLLLPEQISTSPSILQQHGQDESYHPAVPPQVVVYPESVEQVRSGGLLQRQPMCCGCACTVCCTSTSNSEGGGMQANTWLHVLQAVPTTCVAFA